MLISGADKLLSLTAGNIYNYDVIFYTLGEALLLSTYYLC